MMCAGRGAERRVDMESRSIVMASALALSLDVAGAAIAQGAPSSGKASTAWPHRARLRPAFWRLLQTTGAG